MSKKLIVIILLNLVFIFLMLAQLTHDYKYAWRGLAIVLGISAVTVAVVAVFGRTK